MLTGLFSEAVHHQCTTNEIVHALSSKEKTEILTMHNPLIHAFQLIEKVRLLEWCVRETHKV